MVSKTKLVLVSCSRGETEALTKDILGILKRDYGLEDEVESIVSLGASDVLPGTPKDHRHDLVCDFFDDQEVRVDIGANLLRGQLYGRHVVLIEHLLTPRKDAPSVNDHIAKVRGLLDVISNVDTLQRTLVSPYAAYVRSHSVEKYEAMGFYQFDALKKMMQDMQRDGLTGIITIDPHSDKLLQIAEDLGMQIHAVNPFQSARAINPRKLGLSGEKAVAVLKQLRPFQERFAERKSHIGERLYFVSVDDGTERRCENFAERAYIELPPEVLYPKVVYMFKERSTVDGRKMGFKKFSDIREGNVPDGTYIIIDDMIFTGGTANDAGRIIKQQNSNAKVELWTSHPVSMPKHYSKVNGLQYVDKIVSLDTVPQPADLKVERIPASAHLLAAEVYKSHAKLVAKREAA